MFGNQHCCIITHLWMFIKKSVTENRMFVWIWAPPHTHTHVSFAALLMFVCSFCLMSPNEKLWTAALSVRPVMCRHILRLARPQNCLMILLYNIVLWLASVRRIKSSAHYYAYMRLHVLKCIFTATFDFKDLHCETFALCSDSWLWVFFNVKQSDILVVQVTI